MFWRPNYSSVYKFPYTHIIHLLNSKMESSLKTLNSLSLYKTSLSSLSLSLPNQIPSLPPPFPPSKHIPKTHFLIDAFRFSTTASTTAYFLTHFHSDHYSGLSSNWCQGIIFCSHITANLLIKILNVPSQFVYPLNLNDSVVIDGSLVTLIDANHCPGAVQFLFKVKNLDSFEMYVHTGDFRYCSDMEDNRFLCEFVGCDAVFLDTTYCNPKFVSPKQEESIDYVVSTIEGIGGGEFVMGQEKKSVLFLVATYVVGKERILVEIAKRCRRKVHVDGRRMEVLRVLGYGDCGMFTEDESETDVHVVGWNVLGETWPYFRPNFVNMKEIMVERGYSRVVGFVPTGWTYEVKRNKFSVRTKDSFEIHLVPYSEHSNYNELREYVKFLRPKRVIPTVGIDIANLDSKHAIKMQKHFAGLVDEMANKKQLLMGFYRGSSENDEKVEMENVCDLNEGLDRENEVKLSEVKAIEGSVPGVILNSSSALQEQTLTALNGEETEKIIQELSDFLPAWVTRDQMLHLIGTSGGNLVDAVSDFHERETEYYQQVFTCRADISPSQTGLIDESESLSESVSVKSSQESLSTPSSQNNKFLKLNAKPSIKSGMSPGKKKRTVENKPSKKVKTKSKLESGGQKQPTITSFFSKLVPNVSQGSGGGLTPNPVNENILPNKDIQLYKEEIDQFIQIIDGNEASRGYAATILERTKGNINKALDMHYGNPESNFGESIDKLVASGDLAENQCHNNECPSAQDKTVLDADEQKLDLSLQRPLTENLVPAHVALPTEKYNPIQHACWRIGEPAPYIHLARTFDLVQAEKGKIKATSMMCNMFRSLLALSPEDVLPTVYLCTNKIAADHENIELNIGGSLVTSALEEACGTNLSKIRDMYNSLGDLGDVAQVLRQTQTLLAPPPHLLIRDVFSVLQKISVQTGRGSIVRKKNLIVNLMRSCREKEMKFIVRTLVKNLRIGAMLRTVLPALAQAVVMNSLVKSSDTKKDENLKEKLQYLSAAVVEAYNILPSLDLIIPSLLSKGIDFSTSTLSMVPGVPIKPMLAKITNGVSQVLQIFQDKAFTCEYKYDGQRAQIHKLPDGSIRVFSRNGEETTSRFPDLINIMEDFCKPAAMTFIVDAEVVAVDRKNDHKLMSFQELSSRERGSKDLLITVDKIKVQITVFVFDIMFANGEQLLELPLRQRRKYLKDLFDNERKGYFEYAKEMTVEAHDASLTNEITKTKMTSFLEDALQHSCEGIMVKTLDVHAEYSPSKRTDTWLKVKRDYVDGLNDSLDLVPIGAWHGNGRKAGWYSPFLMACYNPDAEEFQSVCRVMSGFSDAFYTEMKEFFSGDRILLKKPPYYRTAEVPDKWFSPELVWEIRGAEFTVSPVHQAAVGLVHPSRGISMRFPRFIRSVTDRNAEECSTAEDIAEMFNSQTRKMDVTTAN